MNFDKFRGIFFEGCIPTNGKTAFWKDWQNRESYPSYSELNEEQDSIGGVLCDNAICIDVDFKEQAEVLFSIVKDNNVHCLVVETDKGMHFYFMNNAKRWKKTVAKYYSAIGLQCDPRTGSKSYLILKLNGKERQIIYDSDTGSYDEIPFWLLPIDKTDPALWKMKDGDGRDCTLYSYILKLMRYGFSKEEVKETFSIINNYVFEDKLRDKDIERITRNDAFPKEIFFDDKKKFRHEQMAKMLIRELSIKLKGDKLFSFNGAFYEPGEANIRRECIRLYDGITVNQRKEVISSIRDRLEPCDLIPSDKFICFKNGLLNLNTWKLEDFDSSVILFNQIPHNYDEKAFNEDADKALNDWCNEDQELRTLLEEIIGYGLIANIKAQKSFFIHGEKNNGKSTFLEWLKAFYGKANVVNFDLQKMNGRFNSQYLENALANICNDIPKSGLSNEEQSTFKQVVTGDSTYGEIKGGAVTFFNPYVKLFFSCNTVPSIKDENGEIARRIIVIPFMVDFTGKESIDLDDKLREESAFEYLAVIAVAGLKRLIGNKYQFTPSTLAEEAKEREFTHVDTVREFINRVVTEADYIQRKSKTEVYRDYKSFCIEMEKLPVDKNAFSREFMATLELYLTEVKNKFTGKTERVYRKRKDK